MIQAYCNHRQVEKALTLLEEMNSAGMTPDEYTYSIVLKTLTDNAYFEEGQRIHNKLRVQTAN